MTTIVAGNRVLVDDIDAKFVTGFYLSLVGTGYVRCTERGWKNRGRSEYLHRKIMGLQKGDKRQVDHKNHNKLDNRRSNLRVVDQATNQQNRRVAPKYYYFREIGGIKYWIVQIQRYGKKYIQAHHSESEAQKDVARFNQIKNK